MTLLNASVIGCDKCGADGPLEPDGDNNYCAVCLADLRGWQEGRRCQALVHLAEAVQAAVGADCTSEQVGAMVEDALNPDGYSETAAIELAVAGGRS